MPEPLPARGDRLRVYAVLLLTMAVMGLLFHATQASLPKVFDLRLRDLAGEGARGIAALVALVYTAGGLLQLVGGWLADRYPLRPISLRDTYQARRVGRESVRHSQALRVAGSRKKK